MKKRKFRKLNDSLWRELKKHFSPPEITQIRKLGREIAQDFEEKYGGKLPLSIRLDSKGGIVVEGTRLRSK